MIRTLSFYKRKPGISHEAFSRHWREVHGPLCQANPIIRKYVRSYVQHHLTPVDGVEALEFDGFSESTYACAEDRDAVYAAVYGGECAEILADEEHFLDSSATRVMMLDMPLAMIGEKASA